MAKITGDPYRFIWLAGDVESAESLTASAAPRGDALSRLITKRERALRLKLQVLVDRLFNKALTAALTDDELEALEEIVPAAELLLAKDQKALLTLMARYGVDERTLDETAERQAADRRGAGAWLKTALVDYAALKLVSHAAHQPARGETPEGISVSPNIVRSFMTLGGGGASPDTVNHVTGQLQGGVWTGSEARNLLDKANQSPVAWRWVYGEAGRKTSFLAHEELDGIEFGDWQTPELAVSSEDSWLGVDYYHPGDHWGCLCEIVPVILESLDEDLAPALDEEALLDAEL